MIGTTIESIEKKIANTNSMGEEDKKELLKLLSTLETEVLDLSKTHPEEAESIAGFTQLSAHEATRGRRNEQLVRLSTKGLTSSIEGFENTHEELVRIVNSIAYILSNMGL
jgi:hypothetical protein